jgi:hypothetical protein
MTVCIQKTYPDMDLRDAIELINNHRLNKNNFLHAEFKPKKDDVVEVIEYYEK